MPKLACLIICLVLAGLPWLAEAQSPSDLNQEIQAKQQRLAELRRQLDSYQTAIAQKQLEATSLRRQLEVLDDKLAQTALDIESNQLSLDTVALQIQAVSLEIAKRERDLAQKRSQVSQLIREAYRAEQQSLLEIVVLHATVGQFFEQLNYLESLQHTLQARINQAKLIKAELEHRQQDLASYQAQLVSARERLEQAKANLQIEQDTKQNILTQTRQSEKRYQNLVEQAQAEQAQANRDIQALEQQVRSRLSGLGPSALNQLGQADFSWPVSPTRGIATYFYDPTYIFRRYFEHPGIDIPRPQGSVVVAAASGYVARAKDAGLGYSYIMLVHGGSLATVYGHVSRIDVAEGSFVTKGQIIGAVGGLPGTRGAGSLTTGPHLHFEVRLNGIPVDPLGYLP